ncbi:uncharacterized protein CIMG_05008 [Coccidioides immitis RS]|uniref:Uncharacterized protein n=2 Tax=Coccidioides immitis TaxID=5501 RepID=J3KEQ2_COCIM|nr:uncharacterized protein CIMG_05008 [Coccidioides immitis RS]EAS33984.3 hypothetical protein CIMG_05008 [Coccidioides immitis RS]KMP05199.1 hypothetical protein CIRG_04880 [Coccidioides immitis RMSCC 2394]TPX21587.1 hypothetical protein DIZ76_015546 [Coccidioides immitis]
MVLREDDTSLIPGMFDNAVGGNVLQIQAFMNEFITKILKEANYNAKVVWTLPMREDVVERIRHFEILRDGFVLAYGAVSEKETIDDMKAIEARRLNEEVLRPQHRPGGYISVTAKSDSGLKVEFAIVHRDEGDSPEIKPALVNSEKSTVELDYNEPLAGPEAVFRAFLHECIIFLPIAEIQ